MKDSSTLIENEGSWHEFANLLFVDNPLGTGFSFVDSNQYVQELDQMTDQFIHFMDKFIDLFPEYANDDVGQSAQKAETELTLLVLHCR